MITVTDIRTSPAQGIVSDIRLSLANVRQNLKHIAKRAFDIGASIFGILVLSPLFFTIAACIKLTDGGPILYRQTRVGKNGKTFQCLKFRSMIENAESLKNAMGAENSHNNSITFKSKNDPRITLIGKIIRKTSMDELPQFFNVIFGDMSLVGPRPALVSEVENYTMHDRKRLRAMPGITCIWQISGRGDIPFDEQVEMDLEYIKNQTLLLDIKILFLTVPAVISGKGAY